MRILRCLPYALLIALTTGFGLREFSWHNARQGWQAETVEQARLIDKGKDELGVLRGQVAELNSNLLALDTQLQDQSALVDQREQQIILWQRRSEELRVEMEMQAAETEALRTTLRSERSDWLQRERERRQLIQDKTSGLKRELAELHEALNDCQSQRTAPVAFATVSLQARSSGRSMLALARPEDFPYQRDATVLLRNSRQHWTTATVRDATADFLLLQLPTSNEFGDTLVKAENLIMVWPTES